METILYIHITGGIFGISFFLSDIYSSDAHKEFDFGEKWAVCLSMLILWPIILGVFYGCKEDNDS